MMITLLAERALSIRSFTAIDGSTDSDQTKQQQATSPVSIAEHLQQEQNGTDLEEGNASPLEKYWFISPAFDWLTQACR